jgi:hypothetical protein
MSVEKEIDPWVLKFVALLLADGLMAGFMSASELAALGPDLDWKRSEIKKRIGEFVSREDFERARAHCLQIVDRTVSLLDEFSEDIVEGRSGWRGRCTRRDEGAQPGDSRGAGKGPDEDC